MSDHLLVPIVGLESEVSAWQQPCLVQANVGRQQNIRWLTIISNVTP
ncbi:MAG: hypothetical protein GY943_36595 [Chloroflexi bacterium]|nr:hypothetical protein [Chloroflexota bacterium]